MTELDALREMKPAEKFLQAVALSSSVRQFTLAGIRDRNPQASPAEIRYLFACQMIGKELADKYYSTS